MPSSINFWHSDPRRRFRSVVEDDLRTAAELDVAVAFMTEAGVDFLLGCLGEYLSQDKCRVSVSVQFPTDLAALKRLSDRLGGQLRIHLQTSTKKEKSSRSSPLMHSKVIWAGGEEGKVTILLPVITGKALPPSVALFADVKSKVVLAASVIVVAVPGLLLAVWMAVINSPVVAGLESSVRCSKASRHSRTRRTDARRIARRGNQRR
jgi:hypothetical protein